MTLTAPQHIIGHMQSGTCPRAAQRAKDRLEWIGQAIAAGHTDREISHVLGLGLCTLRELIRRSRRKGHLQPVPVAAPVAKVVKSDISLHRAPWEAETGHDPRHETTPRFSLVRPAPQSSRIDAVIAAIRAEAGMAQA